MRKRIISPVQEQTPLPQQEWLDLEDLADVELTSEDDNHPIETALLPDDGQGWRAADPGQQTIRLLFRQPQQLQRIWLSFRETRVRRTQEYVLRWSPDGGESYQEIIRQQWNFSPDGTTRETEDLQVDLAGVTALELIIVPDISGGEARASLRQLRLG